MAQPTLALAMIVRNSDEDLPLLSKCLENVSPHVDAIYVNLNHRPGEEVSKRVQKLLAQYTKDVFITEWHDDFAGARNMIFSEVPKKYDWIVWLDVDDTVDEAYKMRDVIAIAPSNVGGIFAQYDYSHDDLGNVTYTHWVIRMCRNNGAYKWKSSFDDGEVSVHETLQDIRTSTNVRTEDFKVVHGSNATRSGQSLSRNINLLEGMYERQLKKGNVDPRILYYLATHYFEASNRNPSLLSRCEELLVEYLQKSGWAEERSEAWVYMGLIFRVQGRNDAARQAFGKSILENPANPKPYVELGELEFKDKRYFQSEEWLLTGISKKLPTTSTVIMPMENTFRAYLLLAQTYINMGFSKLDEAQEFVTKALEMRPQDDDAKGAQELIQNLQKTRDDTKAFLRIASVVDDRLKLVNLLPADMQDNPAVLRVRQDNSKPLKWYKNEVAIFCGNSAQGLWGPKDLDKTGMGGSEEAVIKMSYELSALGYRVTVYATPGEQAGIDPVTADWPEPVEWKHYWEFNPKDEFNILVAWRMPWFFDATIKAKQSYLWLHDVMDKEEFTSERLSKVTGVLFVSAYHAGLYDGVIPANKRIVSGNGITPAEFNKYDGAYNRDPHKLIYTSSQLRGLEALLDIFPEVKKAVPDATLDIYYGWETFDESNRQNPQMMEWKDKMIRRIQKLDGVTDYGRVGQDQLNQELFKAGVFAYPCWFPEVYCISLIKAQAAGVYPVTSDYAVLKDYNLTGKKVHYDPKHLDKFRNDYKKILIAALKEPKPISAHIKKEIRERFSWERTAKGWDKQFKRG